MKFLITLVQKKDIQEKASGWETKSLSKRLGSKGRKHIIMWWDYTKTYSAFSRNLSLLSVRGISSAMVIQCFIISIWMAQMSVFPALPFPLSSKFWCLISFWKPLMGTSKPTSPKWTNDIHPQAYFYFCVPLSGNVSPFTGTHPRNLCVNLKFSFGSFFLIKILLWFLSPCLHFYCFYIDSDS